MPGRNLDYPCPNLPTRIGPCKEIQSSDHILTLDTLVNKYNKKQKGSLFTCFVDHAFDTVCRDALIYKIVSLGIRGNIFNCLHYMYENSFTRIKLILPQLYLPVSCESEEADESEDESL